MGLSRGLKTSSPSPEKLHAEGTPVSTKMKSKALK